MRSKKYYKDINLIRVIACIGVILYHLNILKGGYLAVCIFFVLSGYLSTISAFKKDDFSLKNYYKNRLSKIYIPLLSVVFITIAVISLLPNISWFNLKPETTSVLLGYNNFWQLDANLDYFARHINSPFMHLWYISILLQFDLIFPFIFLILKKIGDKISRIIPTLITIVISIISALYFYKTSQDGNIMFTYYNTFTRSFSLILGLSLGFIHLYYKPILLNIFKHPILKNTIFYSYLIITIILFIYIDASHQYFALVMILVSLITCRLIDYGTINKELETNTFDKIIKSLSNITYEIYLIQYPVIFLFQEINMNIYLEMFIMIIIILILSYIIHYALNKESRCKILKYLLLLILLAITSFGVYNYIIAIDHTEEMKTLEEELAKNAEILKKKQEEYALKQKEEENVWMETLNNLEDAESKLKDVVTNLSITGIGDSVMLGAINNLYETFPNGYFDAATSRTAWVAKGIINDLKNKNILGNVILFNLGANGDAPEEKKIEIMNNIKDTKVFWLTVTNDKDVHVNDKLYKLKEKYDNLYIIDWANISKDHPEYFLSDKIHLTEVGRKAFVDEIYNAIFEVYLGEFNKQKDAIIKEYEEKQNKKVTFFGNDILLNSYDYIKENFNDSNFVINSNFTFELLKQEIETLIGENKLNKKIVFAFDKKLPISNIEYIQLISLCKDHNIYILDANNQYSFTYENVNIINFYNELAKHKEYLMIDNIHLTEEGSIALSNILNEKINTVNK